MPPPQPLPGGAVSLRRRLARFVLVLALAWVAVATVLLTVWLRHEVHELLDDGLVATSEALAVVLHQSAAAVGADGEAAALQALPAVPPAPQALPALPPGGAASAAAAAANGVPATQLVEDTPFAWQVVDAQRRVLMRSPNAPPAPLAATLQDGLVHDVQGWRVRCRALANGRWLLVGQQTTERLEATLEVVGGTVGVALLVSLVGLAFLRWRLDRETRPLDDLGRVLAAYDPMQPGRSLPAPALAELAPVHEAVQQMGERLAAHAAAERAFSAHAAHALRTPLAGLDAQLAVAQREAPPALQPRLARMRSATGRLAHVVGALLALFRSGGELKRAAVDVHTLLARVPLEGLEVRVEAAAAPAGVAAAALPRPLADPDLLAAALFNLLDNALRHGAHRVVVQVHAAHITLLDDGPGVSAERLALLQQALLREDAGLGTRDQADAGLGLALADRVARVHGGRLELLAPPAGFGVRLWLTLPPEPPEPPEPSSAAGAGAAAARERRVAV